ncbi:MAG: hypothetical protein IPP47_33380 [Bryobacterales bacterium]|nr:hypothetical protein [Bryobacterales bacterium]
MILSSAALLLAMATTPRILPAEPARPMQRISACAAATRQELQRALGAAIEAGKLRPEAGGSSCEYEGERGHVSISLRHAVAALDFEAEIHSLKAALPEARLVEIPMSGVRALLVDLDESGAQIHVLRGGRDYLLISVLGFGNAAQTRAIAETIAQRALTRF